MTDSADNGIIKFTVKELLADMNDTLKKIMDRLDGKADSHDVDALAARVALIELEGRELRAVARALKTDKSERFTRSEKVVGFLLTLAALVPGWAALYLIL